jgi:hypothetical protein
MDLQAAQTSLVAFRAFYIGSGEDITAMHVFKALDNAFGPDQPPRSPGKAPGTKTAAPQAVSTEQHFEEFDLMSTLGLPGAY